MHSNKILKTSIVFIVFFIFYTVAGAQNSSKEIDSISKLIEKKYRTGDTNPGLTSKYVTELYYLSREKKFYPGQIHAIFEEVKLYHNNGNFDATLSKIKEGIELAKAHEDFNMLCRILLLYQKTLLQMDFLSTAKQILGKSEDYNKKVTIKEDKLINNIYILLAKADMLSVDENFDKNKVNEIIKLKKTAYSECVKISDNNRFKKVTVIYTLESLANSLARFKKLNEAREYIAIIDRFLAAFPDDAFIIQNLINKGMIEKAEGNYEVAVDYFSRALLDSQRDHNRHKEYELYAMISESYEGMKEFEKATLFSKKYKRLVDSMDVVRKRSGDISFINKINLNISDKKEIEKTAILNWIIIAVFISLAIVIIFYKNYNKKKNTGLQPDNSVQVSDNNTPEPESENITEKNTLNAKPESTKELILLAKEDINAFYIEFQKVYPSFYPFLKEKYPDLNISDINFCSLVKMNFGIKEISQYTNSTIRAAEARRYRINKKMQIKNQNELYMLLSTIN